MKYSKLFAVFVSFAVAACEPIQNRVSETSDGCTSRKLSESERKRRNLFLTFYYGMTHAEFNAEKRKLINNGALVEYDNSTHTVQDSSARFCLVTTGKYPEKCYFEVHPSFDDCILYSVSLNYIIPANSSTATLKSYGSYTTQAVPNIIT